MFEKLERLLQVYMFPIKGQKKGSGDYRAVSPLIGGHSM